MKQRYPRTAMAVVYIALLTVGFAALWVLTWAVLIPLVPLVVAVELLDWIVGAADVHISWINDQAWRWLRFGSQGRP